MPPPTGSGTVLTVSHEDNSIYPLKLLCLSIVQFINQAWFLPQSIATALRLRRRQMVRNAFEIERLDRIRHPSKYLGK
jgi:hypothetical protein